MPHPTITSPATNEMARVLRTVSAITLAVLYVGAFVANTTADVKRVANRRIAEARADAERGEISSTTVIIALLVLLAVTVGGIITTKITERAELIETE